MHAFTERLAQRIEQPQPDTIENSLVDAGEIMRMWRFFNGDPGGSAVVGPFSDEAGYPHMQADDIERLKQAVVTFVQQHPRDRLLGRAVFALYYLAAPDTKSLLVEVLRDCLGRDSGALYQTILALEALGDNLYGPRLSTSYDEVEKNERVAREYLSSQKSAV
jgi:hypothetical protein